MENKTLKQPEWEKKGEMTIHCILAGILMNGYIQGQTKPKLDNSVLDVAKKLVSKEIQKSYKQGREETKKCPICSKPLIWKWQCNCGVKCKRLSIG